MVFIDDDGQFEDALGQEETLEQRNGGPEDVTWVAQLSRSAHHQNDEGIQKQSNDDHQHPEALLDYADVLPHDGQVECLPEGVVDRGR